MPEFLIDEVLDRLRVLGSVNVSGPQGEWIRETREVLEGYKARTAAITSAAESSEEGKWEVTLVVSEPPDLGCVYALVPFSRQSDPSASG